MAVSKSRPIVTGLFISWLLLAAYAVHFMMAGTAPTNSDQQWLWIDPILLALFAITSVLAPWLTILHLRALATSESARDRATYLAMYDALTALPNRIGLADHFSQTHQNGKIKGIPFGLVLINLDGFKRVNDQHGHDVGDEVLKAISSRLNGVFRSLGTITRYGGDEFIAIVADVWNPDQCSLIGQKILAATAEPIKTTAGPMQIGCSIGVSICPIHGHSLDTLRKAAHQAMCHSKQQGGNKTCVFVPSGRETALV